MSDPEKREPVEASPFDSRPPTTPEAVQRRRTTQRFDPEGPVEAATIAQILRLATFAASPYNLQPWRFLVVRDAANRRRLQTYARNQPVVGQAPVVVIVLGFHEPDRTHLDAMLARGQAIGAFTIDQAAATRGRANAALGRVTDRADWATRAAMRAATTLVLAAESMGVASALVEEFNSDAVRSGFGVPDDHAICCLIALGRAAEVAPFPGRLELDEVAYCEHFGQPWTS